MIAPYPAPRFRIRVADSWTDPLVELPQQTPKGSGYLVERYDVDIVLPNIGEAVISRLYGNIGGRNYGEPEDLERKHIIIEVDTAVPTLDDPEPTPIWRCEFWGILLGEQREEMPGSDYPAGRVQYYAKGGSWILTQGRMDLHQWSYLVDSTLPSRGHPGYNVTSDGAELMGNQDSRSAGRFFMPGHFYSAPWLDSQVLRDCLADFRYGDWMGTIALGADNLGLLSGARGYSVTDSMHPMDIIKQVLDRAHTSAVAVLRFADSVGSTLSGSLGPKIEIFPSEYATIEYTRPSDGAAQTIDGALAAGTSIDLDFTDMPEIDDADYLETKVDNTLFDAVETVGDRLQIIITAKPLPKWTSDEETAYNTFSLANPDISAKGDIRFADVLARVGWGGGGPLGALDRGEVELPIDLETDTQTGEIRRATEFIANPLAVMLVDDLPLLVGYDYYSSSLIGGRGADESGIAAMVPWQAWEKTTTGYYRDLTEGAGLGLSRGQAGNDVEFTSGGTEKPLDTVDLDNLRVTVCVELPTRLRLVTGDLTQRVIRVDAEGNKLVMADTGAILALDYTDDSGAGFAPIYPSVNPKVLSGPTSTVYVIRDDRDQLAAIHAQAVAHHTSPRRTIEFTIRGAYGPRWNGIRCGVVIHELTANGKTKVIDTPITKISYNARENSTRIVTDYAERRWRV